MDAEKDLIRKCQEGRDEAQAALFSQYSAAMFGICLRYAKNREEARDLLHDGFIKVFTGIKSFKAESSLKTWMTSIFINTALSHVRQHARITYVTIDETEAADIPEPESSDWEHIIRSLTQQDVLAFLQELPEKYRLILNLYCIDGYPHRDIAVMLNVSEGTSKSQLSRARKLLVNLIMQKKMTYEKAS